MASVRAPAPRLRVSGAAATVGGQRLLPPNPLRGERGNRHIGANRIRGRHLRSQPVS